jgi:hypothetical protein
MQGKETWTKAGGCSINGFVGTAKRHVLACHQWVPCRNTTSGLVTPELSTSTEQHGEHRSAQRGRTKQRAKDRHIQRVEVEGRVRA